MANLPLPPVQRFRERLQKLGWVEGKNLLIEYRYGEGRDDRFPEFAAELVSMPVDILVVWGTPAAFAAKRATTTIPGLSRVVVLTNPANPLSRASLDTARQAAEKLAVKIEVVEAKSAADVESALAKIKTLHPDAVVIAPDTQLLSKRKEIADFMAEQRLPAIYPFREYASVGGLFIYGANLSVLFERAAEYLDKLLKGEKVSNLPVQQATTFELIVNTRTASAIGLTVPREILLRADDVIE